jgi:hypothetical protein
LVILDFGCGPGRDLKTFAGLGHTAIGLEGAAGFAAMARADTGCEVWEQDFHRLELRQLQTALKPGGVLFTSNPHGRNEEGWNRIYPAHSGALEAVCRVTTAQMVSVAEYKRTPQSISDQAKFALRYQSN